ncbi:maternal protein exuperantia-like [Chelonus insularis]|uniref:maternal protein exuperantia-like n=1 Tax=Chelonus insularis TaxID=460826 RepID=UPI00158C467D|nr:maternal protein exuperantia-like [Chelonus insularis]
MVLENKLIITEKPQLVYLDIESTGFVGSEIIQIAVKCNSDEFSAYIMPSKNIPPHITDLTGIKLYNGTLVVDSSPVLTLSPRQAANEFLSYLKNFGENIILAAHNCFTFDGPMILQFMQEVDVIDEFSLIVKGFTDTLPVMKKHLKDRTKAKKRFKRKR